MTEIFLFLQSENSNYFLEDFFVEEEVLLAQLEELFLEDEELFLQEQEESCSTAIAQKYSSWPFGQPAFCQL